MGEPGIAVRVWNFELHIESPSDFWHFWQYWRKSRGPNSYVSQHLLSPPRHIFLNCSRKLQPTFEKRETPTSSSLKYFGTFPISMKNPGLWKKKSPVYGWLWTKSMEKCYAVSNLGSELMRALKLFVVFYVFLCTIVTLGMLRKAKFWSSRLLFNERTEGEVDRCLPS